MNDQLPDVAMDASAALQQYGNIEPIELESGHALTVRQTQAIMLHVCEGWPTAAIAEALGYSAPSVLYDFFNRDTGREALLLATRRYLSSAAIIGLHTMVKLAKSARSENVRQMAAADLMDRAGLREAAGGTGSGTAIQVNIDLGGGVGQN
jgi:hypothetical protein